MDPLKYGWKLFMIIILIDKKAKKMQKVYDLNEKK